MTDRMTREQRRNCMSRIKSAGTKPELTLRRGLWANGARYRIKSGLVGKPDMVFHRSRLVVFVDGCFWHNCPVHGRTPTSNTTYWSEKLLRNRNRDEFVNKTLQTAGWRVLRIWEHDVRADVGAVVARIMEAIENDREGV